MRTIEERLFPHLMRNEPEAIELSKKQYDDYRTFEQSGTGGKDTKDVESVLPEAPIEEDGAPFSGTRGEAIKILRQRGFEYAKLKNKKKQELIDLL